MYDALTEKNEKPVTDQKFIRKDNLFISFGFCVHNYFISIYCFDQNEYYLQIYPSNMPSMLAPITTCSWR